MPRKGTKPQKSPGPAPALFKIEGDWKEAVKKALQKKKPTDGWPKAEKKQKVMSFRHAAVIALAGWYLMHLPSKDSLHIFSLPWSATQRSFDTAKECEEARAKAVVPSDTTAASIHQFMSTQPQSSPTAALAQPAKPIEDAYYCIASDDPRLRGNQ